MNNGSIIRKNNAASRKFRSWNRLKTPPIQQSNTIQEVDKETQDMLDANAGVLRLISYREVVEYPSGYVEEKR